MRFACKKCKTQYTMADERVRERIVKFRCKKCNTILVVRGFSGPAGSSGSAEPKAGWFVGLDGVGKGPFPLPVLQSMIRSGEVSRDSFVWKKGMPAWVPLEKIPKLSEALWQGGGQEQKSQSEAQHRQEDLYRKRREEREKRSQEENEKGRQDLLKRVHQKREKARADRHADRIASHFFDTGGRSAGADGVLPPPPVSTEQLADKLELESIQEEHEALQHDPLAVLLERDRPGRSEISKVLAAQAGMGVASKGRRFTVTLLSVAGVLAILGGGVYLVASQGWLGAFGSVKGGKNSNGRLGTDMIPGELSEEEARRLRDTLWNVKQKPRTIKRIVIPGFDLQPPEERSPEMTEEERKLQEFYQKQGEEKQELAPRIPKSAMLPTPQTVDLPTAPVSSIDAPLPTAKTELTPTGPESIAGPERLSEFQVRLVIQKHYQQVKSCLERQLKRDASISGKMYVVARVNPNGKVENVSIATAKFHGTYVEECLVKEVKRWDFPAFAGETYDIYFPLLLSARQSYK